MYFKFSLFLLLLIATIGCNSSDSESKAVKKMAGHEEHIEVDIQILTNEVFQKELISNGKLKAMKKSDLKFAVSGQLKKLEVKNGNSVSYFQNIAIVDQFEYKQRMEQAETNLHTANLEVEDLLLGRGYHIEDTAKVPASIYKMIRIRSGHIAAVRELKTASYNLEGTVLKAPFPGKIANLKYHQYEQVSPGEVFCTLIDDAAFEVEFNLVEGEIKDIKIHNEVEITPFSVNATFKGYISEINPSIDEHGLVLVKAEVKNRRGQLMDGMNVKVSVKKQVPAKLVVPKSAVVLRQNQEVLFKYVHGRAFWTYIQLEFENSGSYAVIAHPDKGGTLEPGDTVIVSGNLNLAHESEVTIK